MDENKSIFRTIGALFSMETFEPFINALLKELELCDDEDKILLYEDIPCPMCSCIPILDKNSKENLVKDQ